MSSRQQFVSISGWRSQSLVKDFRVPQGSVLDPLHFLMFTTPAGNMINTFSIQYHMYADDTQLYTDIDTSSPDSLSQLTACIGAVTSGSSGIIYYWTQTRQKRLSPEHVNSSLSSISRIASSCPARPFRSFRNYAYSGWLLTANWASTTTSPTLFGHAIIIYRHSAIVKHSSIVTGRTQLHARSSFQDSTTVMPSYTA